MTVSEAREEKAKMSGDHEAWIEAKKLKPSKQHANVTSKRIQK